MSTRNRGAAAGRYLEPHLAAAPPHAAEVRMPNHTPVRRARSLWLRRECTCGRWRWCDPPLWTPGTRIPDGDRVPWPTNAAHRATEATRELNPRPFLTPGQAYRFRGWGRA